MAVSNACTEIKILYAVSTWYFCIFIHLHSVREGPNIMERVCIVS